MQLLMRLQVLLEQLVALGQAEQAQHLLGGGVRALALLWVDGKLADALAADGSASSSPSRYSR